MLIGVLGAGFSEYNLLSRGHYVEPNTHTSAFLGNTFNRE